MESTRKMKRKLLLRVLGLEYVGHGTPSDMRNGKCGPCGQLPSADPRMEDPGSSHILLGLTRAYGNILNRDDIAIVFPYSLLRTRK